MVQGVAVALPAPHSVVLDYILPQRWPLLNLPPTLCTHSLRTPPNLVDSSLVGLPPVKNVITRVLWVEGVSDSRLQYDKAFLETAPSPRGGCQFHALQQARWVGMEECF